MHYIEYVNQDALFRAYGSNSQYTIRNALHRYTIIYVLYMTYTFFQCYVQRIIIYVYINYIYIKLHNYINMNVIIYK